MSVVAISGGKDAAVTDDQHAAAHYWKRRLAAQLISQLPDDYTDALEILAEAARLIRMPASES